MAISGIEALLRIVETAGTQLDLLEDAAKRPEVDRSGLSEAGLDLLLQAIAASAGQAEAEGPAGDQLRAFADRLSRYRRASVHLNSHLFELAEDWLCSSCGSDTPISARISGVRVGSPRVEIVCRNCGTASKLNPKGKKAFDRWFGPLINADWNPKLHGFEWDGR